MPWFTQNWVMAMLSTSLSFLSCPLGWATPGFFANNLNLVTTLANITSLSLRFLPLNVARGPPEGSFRISQTWGGTGEMFTRMFSSGQHTVFPFSAPLSGPTISSAAKMSPRVT